MCVCMGRFDIKGRICIIRMLDGDCFEGGWLLSGYFTLPERKGKERRYRIV